MPFFTHDQIKFHYLDSGPSGVPLVFQHGLGGYAQLAYGLAKPPPGFRVLSFDFRGHGRSLPPGNPARFTFDTFAKDLLALVDHLQLRQAVIGGISLGAGVALNLALRFPERVLGLVLARPSSMRSPCPWKANVFTMIARLLREHGAQRGQELFKQTCEYREALAQCPDTANSLALQFTSPQAVETAFKLDAFARQVPWPEPQDWKRIRVPVLVLASRSDPVHPFEAAQELAAGIDRAEFHEIISRSVSVIQHTRDVQQHVAKFLMRHFVHRA